MTTAKLSVGIDTSEAFASLKALRAEMQSQPHNLLISVDAKSVDREIAGYLKQRTFRIRVDTRAMGSEIENDVGIALDRAFNREGRKLAWNQAALRGGMNAAIDGVFEDKQRRLRYDRDRLQLDLRTTVDGALAYTHNISIDKAALTLQVRQAVQAGLAGGVVTVGGVASAGGAASAAAAPVGMDKIKGVIRDTLVPAVDRMVLAADQIAAAARRTSVGGTVGTAAASRSISSKDSAGFTTSFKQRLDNPEAVLPGVQLALKEKQLETGQIRDELLQRGEQLRRIRAQQAGQELNDIGSRAEMLRARRAQAAGQELNELGMRAEQFRQRRAQTAGEELNETGQRLLQLKRLRAQAAGEELNEVGARAEQLKRMKAQRAFDQQGFAFGPDRSTFDASNAARRLALTQGELTSHRSGLKAFTHTMNEAHSAARGLASGFGAIWLTWGHIAPLMAGAAISHSFVQSLKTGMAVSQELATIQFLGGESAASVATLNAELLRTRDNGLYGPKEVALALKTLSLAGLDVKQQMQGLPAVLNFSIAGQVSLEKSAETLVAVATAYGYTARDFSVVGDLVTKTAASSMASVESMSESFKTASVVAQQYKVSLQDTSITLALLSQMGIKGSAAGTAMRQMYSELGGSSRKARKILEDTLKVDVIDSFTGAMKPLSTIITDISAALDRFSPKAQQRILQEMGNERGTKALSANLTAFRTELDKTGKSATNELARMQKQMEEAPGFMAQAAIGMSMTSQNQVKAIGNTLETSLVKAFQAIEPSLLSVSMKLRATFASPEFQKGVQNLVVGIGNATVTLMQHGGVILEVAKAYALWKAATIGAALIGAATVGVTRLGEAFFALGGRATVAALGTTGLNAALAVAPAMTANAAAGFARLQVAMGVIGVIGTLVAAGVTAWMLYKDKSVEASIAAADAARTTAGATAEAMDKEIASLRKTIELRRQGTEEAGISQEIQNLLGLDNIKLMFETERATLKAAHAQALLNKAKIEGSEYGKSAQGARALQQAETTVAGTGSALANSYYDQYLAEEKHAERVRTLRNVAKQNAKEATEAAAQRSKHQAGTDPFNAPDPGAAHADDMARSRQLISSLNSEEKAMEQYIKFRKQLDDAKYNPKLYGDYVSAALAEQRQIQESANLLKLEEAQIKKLEDAKKSLGNLKDAERTNLDTEIARRREQFQSNQRELTQLRLLAEARREVNEAEGAAGFHKTLSKLSAGTDSEAEKLRSTYSNKIEAPRDAAASEAGRRVEERYRSEILNKQERLNTLQEAETRLMQERAKVLNNADEYDSQRLANLDTGLAGTREMIALEQTRLAIIIAQGKANASAQRLLASSEFENAQTMRYGMVKFWEEYKNSALSNAKIVENTLKSTTANISDAWVQFTTTGDKSFSKFAKNIAMTAQKMLADKAIAQLIGLAVNYFTTSGGGSTSTGSVGMNGDAGVTPIGANFAAHGGVYTPDGPLPLRYYAKGGIEHGPAVTVHGEGTLPEANIPLPDGRTVPVTISGSAGGGNTYISMSVKVDSNGKSDVESDTSGNKAAQLGQMLDDAVIQVINREKRPGGLLYA